METRPTSTPLLKVINPALIDEFGRLYNESRAWAPRQKRLTELTKEICSWFPDLDADQSTVAAGAVFDVLVGKKAIEKSWTSMNDVYKAAGGLKPFLKICGVTYKALSEAIGEPAADALQNEDRTGSRRLVAVLRPLPPAVELPKAA